MPSTDLFGHFVHCNYTSSEDLCSGLISLVELWILHSNTVVVLLTGTHTHTRARSRHSARRFNIFFARMLHIYRAEIAWHLESIQILCGRCVHSQLAPMTHTHTHSSVQRIDNSQIKYIENQRLPQFSSHSNGPVSMSFGENFVNASD